LGTLFNGHMNLAFGACVVEGHTHVQSLTKLTYNYNTSVYFSVLAELSLSFLM